LNALIDEEWGDGKYGEVSRFIFIFPLKRIKGAT